VKSPNRLTSPRATTSGPVASGDGAPAAGVEEGAIMTWDGTREV
jgi:hypothetical protein